MQTTKRTIEQNPRISPRLIRSVARTVGKDYLPDLARHGADGGFPGITYYRDTVAFFKRNRSAIVALVEDMASDLGEGPVDLVAGFRCLGGGRESRDRDLMASVSRCLYGGRLRDEDTHVANALTWFACEEVARAFNPDL